MEVVRCSKCSKRATISLRHPKLNLCAEHFKEYFENRLTKTIKRYKMIKKGESILVAISGGKDSIALLHALCNALGDKVEIKAIHINLGIKQYSSKCLRISRDFLKKLDIEHYIIDLKREYGFTVDEAVSKLQFKRAPCSICGLIKRRVLNDYALKLKVDKLATGHTLDDEATFILTNYASGNLDLLLRSGPAIPTKYGILISRIKPLYEISELETTLYCMINNLSYVEEECPYSKEAPTISLKQMINQIENIRLGFKISLIRTYNRMIKPAISSFYAQLEEEPKFCRDCGYPTNADYCAFCRLKRKIIRKS